MKREYTKYLLICMALLILSTGALYGCDNGDTPATSTTMQVSSPPVTQTDQAGRPAMLGEQTPPAAQPTPPTLPTEAYIDEAMGISITPVDGWVVSQGTAPSGVTRLLISTDTLAPGLAEVYIDYQPDYTAQAILAQIDTMMGNVAESIGAEYEMLYSIESSIGEYPAQQLMFCYTYPDGELYTTVMYVLDGASCGCYQLYYGLGKGMSGNGDYLTQAEEMIHSLSFTGAVASPNIVGNPSQPPVPTVVPQLTPPPDTDDFVSLAGLLRPEEVASTYGDSYIEGTESGILIYQYANVNLGFQQDYYGEYVLMAVGVLKANSPITIGGATAGMTLDAAHAALTANGYEQNMGIGNGITLLYYEGYDDEELVFVTVDVENGMVSVISASWGLAAESTKTAVMSE